MIAVALRCFFFFTVIAAYSSGVWNLINGYFGKEFHAYLQQHPEPPPATAAEVAVASLEAAIKAIPETTTGDHQHHVGGGGAGAGGFPGMEIKKERDDLLSTQDNQMTCTMDLLMRSSVEPNADKAADDGDLTGALNHKAIDETWWADYFRRREETERELETGSTQGGYKYRGGSGDDGNNQCPGRREEGVD